jgi:hypothetical protein
MKELNLFFIKNNKIIALLFALICAYLLFPVKLHALVLPIESDFYFWKSLDPSWAITLNYINNENLIWGKDFAFTYGPLSFLGTRIAWGVNKYSFLIFDLFFLLNYLYIFYYSFKNHNNKLLVVIVSFSLTFFMPLYLGGSLALILFFFLLFWILTNIENPKTAKYVIQIVLIVLLFYIKFNTGLISLLIYYFYLLVLFFLKKEKKLKLLIMLLLSLILIFISSVFLNVDLLGYTKSGIELISGYNEIMYFHDVQFNYLKILAVFFIIISILYLTTLFFIKDNDKKILLFNVVLFVLGIFILYKQCFVRADEIHIKDFFFYSLLLVICCPVFFKNKILNYRNLFVLLLLGINFYVNISIEGNNKSVSKKLSKSDYIKNFLNYTPIAGMYLFPNTNNLPKEILSKIGRSSVDVFPWNIHLLIENNLNYKPRPVIQSYSAYTKFLENLNFNFYNTENAPKFIVYDYESIDNRYPLFDESRVNYLLTKKYTIVDTILHYDRKMLLLEKKNSYKEIKFVKQRDYEIKITDCLKLNENLYYEINVKNNFKGKILSMIDYSPSLNIIITSESEMTKYRTSKALLKSGFFKSKIIRNTIDFANLFDKEFTNSLSNSIQVRPDNYELFEDKIRVTEYKIVQE